MPEERIETGHLPDKLYFRVKEVSQLADVPPYVLRFWETEFSRIRPKRTSSGQRLYRRQDVELILRIRHLLYEKKFTIEGARRYLAEGDPKTSVRVERKALADIESGLRDLLRHLDAPSAAGPHKTDP